MRGNGPQKWLGIGIGLARIGIDWRIDKTICEKWTSDWHMVWHGLAWNWKGFVKIGIDWKGLGPVPIPSQSMAGGFALNSSSEWTRDHPI